MSKNLHEIKRREDIKTYVNALVVESASYYRNWLYGDDVADEKPKEQLSSEESSHYNKTLICD
jgi:hypothetical protein